MDADPRPQTRHERDVARRVASERERRRWSYEDLAKQVRQTGLPMHSSTPFKIEKGQPPRRITIDEFVALATVFGLTLEQLLVPPEVEQQNLDVLLERYVTILRDGGESMQDLQVILGELSERLGGVGPATDAVHEFALKSLRTAAAPARPGDDGRSS